MLLSGVRASLRRPIASHGSGWELEGTGADTGKTTSARHCFTNLRDISTRVRLPFPSITGYTTIPTSRNFTQLNIIFSVIGLPAGIAAAAAVQSYLVGQVRNVF